MWWMYDRNRFRVKFSRNELTDEHRRLSLYVEFTTMGRTHRSPSKLSLFESCVGTR